MKDTLRVKLDEQKFFISINNVEKLRGLLHDFAVNNLSKSELQDFGASSSVDDELEIIGWETRIDDNENIVGIYPYYGDNCYYLDFFKCIAGVVESESYLIFYREDGYKFRYWFEGGKCHCQTPTEIWE